MSLVLVTGPTVEPLSLAEAKAHLRVDATDENDLITSYIVAARQVVENLSGRALINQTWRYNADAFWCSDLLLRPAPLSSITSITYTDDNGTTQTVATSVYLADTDHLPGRVALKYNQSWPSARYEPNSIKVTFVAGYGSASTNVPACAIQACRFLVAHQFENREAVIVGATSKELELTINAMLDPIRLTEFA